jgi:hypothetical protein
MDTGGSPKVPTSSISMSPSFSNANVTVNINAALASCQDSVIQRLAGQLLLQEHQQDTNNAASSSTGLDNVLQLPTYLRFLASLAGHPLPELKSMPESLTQEMVKVDEWMAELSFSEYKSFVETDLVFKALASSLSSTSQSLDRLIKQTPKVSD